MRKIYNFIFVILLFLIVNSGVFSWEESKHPIEYVSIYHIFNTDKYVFCGCSSTWSTNIYGLFVLDREKQIWKNFSKATGFPSNDIKGIKKNGNQIVIKLNQGSIYFDSDLEKYNFKEKISREGVYEDYNPLLEVRIKDKTYTIIGSSIIVNDGKYEIVYSSKVTQPPNPNNVYKLKRDVNFLYPVVLNNKIYFGYDVKSHYSYSTEGVGVFDLKNNFYQFYPTDIFKGGSVTGAFNYNSSIIFSTADFQYESDPKPSVGFIEFKPDIGSFTIWNGLKLPKESFAILCLDSYKNEIWLGTDKGIFRINKNNGEYIHYNIVGGIISKNDVNVHSSFGNFERNFSPILTCLGKGEAVEVTGEIYGWCEIKSPITFSCYILSSDIEEIIEPSDENSKLKVKIKHRRGKAKVYQIAESNKLEPITIYVDPDKKYNMLNRVGDSKLGYFEIEIDTAWVNINDLTFTMNVVESITQIIK